MKTSHGLPKYTINAIDRLKNLYWKGYIKELLIFKQQREYHNLAVTLLPEPSTTQSLSTPTTPLPHYNKMNTVLGRGELLEKREPEPRKLAKEIFRPTLCKTTVCLPSLNQHTTSCICLTKPIRITKIIYFTQKRKYLE